jgi:hypothetical protein
VHQHGLRLVIGVVPYRDGAGASVERDVSQECISSLARCLLHRPALARRKRPYVDTALDMGQSQLSSECLHKTCVGIGVRAAQPVVQVRYA